MTAIKPTTLKLYSTIITFILRVTVHHSRVNSDVSLDVFLLHRV